MKKLYISLFLLMPFYSYAGDFVRFLDMDIPIKRDQNEFYISDMSKVAGPWQMCMLQSSNKKDIFKVFCAKVGDPFGYVGIVVGNIEKKIFHVKTPIVELQRLEIRS